MKRLFLILCVVLWLVESGFGNEPPKNIKIGIADWPPYVDKQHITFGLVPELVQLSFLQEDLDVNFIMFDSWSACLDALLSGEIDGSAPYTSTEEREKILHFSGRSIIELTTAIFYMRDNSAKIPDANIFENQKAFAGFTIGGIKGYFYEDLLKEVNLIYASAPHINFQKLYMGKVDLVIENELIGWHTLSQLYPYSMFRFVELSNSKTTHKGHLVVSKKNQNGPNLIKIFDRSLEKLRQSGVYGEVIKKYKDNFKRLF
jgi:ABC-type amino acid transport substrate-binding protein